MFVDGEKIGEASEFHFDHNVQSEIEVVGPLQARVSDKYNLGDTERHVLGATVMVRVDVLIPPTTSIQSVEIAEPTDSGWRVYEFRDIHAYETTTGSHKHETEFLATELHVGSAACLGPDSDNMFGSMKYRIDTQ